MPWGPTPLQVKSDEAVNLLPPAHPFIPIPSDRPKTYTGIMESQSFVISFLENTNGHTKTIARKTLRLPPNDNQYDKEEVKKRIHGLIVRLERLRHPNICQAVRLVTDKRDGAIAIEVPFYINIMDYNRQNPNVNRVTQVKELTSAVGYLHDQGISHQDISPSIVMITSGGRVCVTNTCLDFSIREMSETGRTSIPANWQYKSPEVLLVITNAGKAADVYSCGATIYAIYKGLSPYYNLSGVCGLVKIVKEGHRSLPRPDEIPIHLWNIIRGTWMLEPSQRLTIAEVQLSLSGL